MTESEFIKKHRQAAGLTQQKAADLLGTSLQQYQRLEYGGRSLLKTNLQLAMSVAILLRFDPGEFVRTYGDGLGDVWASQAEKESEDLTTLDRGTAPDAPIVPDRGTAPDGRC